MSELKPCPFCGGEACLMEDEFGDICQAHVYCEECGVTFSPVFDPVAAKELWNRRASPWISVEERLPEEHGEYLVSRRCRPRGWVMVWAPVGWMDSKEYPVTHWMPLPEGPK